MKKLLYVLCLLLLFCACSKEEEPPAPEPEPTPAPTYGFITDVDGNVYKTVTIGTQTWMAENLKTTKYNDGTAIPEVTVALTWTTLTTGAWCNYNNMAVNGMKYGKLYNWYAVSTGKLAPTGWHVPSDAEWTTLKDYLIANGGNYDGTTTSNKIAKSLAAYTDWNVSVNVGAIGNDLSKNNSSGFTALPGGYRKVSDGSYENSDSDCNLWSTTQFNTNNANCMLLNYYSFAFTSTNWNKPEGMSVRCVKD